MISVIIPIYNVSRYLPQCMESVLSQSYTDLEIILVDDGSTDDCPKMCDNYKEQDARVRVIHKKNGGLSDARNAGMKKATGEWTLFVDSDDWIDQEAIAKLYQFTIENRCDIVQGNVYYVYADHLLYRQASRKEQKNNVLSCQEAMRELLINDRVKNFAWGKLYKTDIIKDLDFPVGKYFEDCFWQHLAIDRAQRYGIVDEPLFYYRQREDSISGMPSNRRNDLLEGNQERLNFIHERYPELYPLMKRRYDEICVILNPSTGLRFRLKRFVQKAVDRFRPNLFKRIER
ncbi:MAG: glycosyltransferase [Bacteroidaceae bacterium]|nr:glycosyltransferase [Bacteroidaceae bacterium]